MTPATPARRTLFSPGGDYAPDTAWGPWSTVIVAVAIVAVTVVLAGLASILLFPPEARRSIDQGGILTLGIWQILMILATFAVATRGRRPAATLALAKPVEPRVLFEALALMLVFQIAATGLELLLVPEQMLRDLRPYAELARGPMFLVGLLVIGVGAPLSEEFLFRGFLFSGLAGSRLGVRGAALVTTLLWTAMHAGYAVTGLLEIFAVGLIFAWLLWKTGSLRVTLLCHAIYNALIMLALRFITLPPAPAPA